MVTLDDFALVAEKLRGRITYLYLHLMGEPTIHPELTEMLKIAAESGFKVIITTNGTTLAEKGDILINGGVYKVSISLHSFEANRQNGINIDEYLDGCLSFAKKASEKGVITVLRLWNLDGENTRGENSLNCNILSKIGQIFPEELWVETRSGIRVGDKVFIEFAQKFKWPTEKENSRLTEEDDFFCHGLRDQIGILCDGTLVPCCLDSDGMLPLGNIFTSSFDEIMASQKVREFYRLVSARKCPSELCAGCEYARRFSKKKPKSIDN